MQNKKKRLENAKARSATVLQNDAKRAGIVIDEIQDFAIPFIPTTLTHTIRLTGETHGLKVEDPHVVCTCGEFDVSLDEEHTTLLYLGMRAKQHAEETGHVLRGRE
jgi:hypothetical protein